MTDAPPDERPWRKRHPVLSRSILYALGLGLAVLLFVLYTDRRADDEATSAEALRKELNDLSLVMAIDPDGSQVLRILDEKFSDPQLPVEMRGRALRWRALAHRAGGRHEKAADALHEAAGLELPPRERLALRIEWAEARMEAGDLEGAMRTLPRDEAIDGPLGLVRDLVEASIEFRGEHPLGGATKLMASLDLLNGPLAEEPVDYAGGRPWTLSQVATVMTEQLARSGFVQGDEMARYWRRLERLASRDFDAQVAATRGYLALERRSDARRTWARARTLDPAQAAAAARSDPVLARLKDGAD